MLADVFDHRLAVFQGPFKLLPDQGLDQGIPGLQDQVAAIGAMDWLALAVVVVVLPAILTWAFGLYFRKIGWIREGDLKLG